MKNAQQKAFLTEGTNQNNIFNISNETSTTSIITFSSNDNFLVNDWKNSGISEEIINDYISKGYLKSNANEWQLSYT